MYMKCKSSFSLSEECFCITKHRNYEVAQRPLKTVSRSLEIICLTFSKKTEKKFFWLSILILTSSLKEQQSSFPKSNQYHKVFFCVSYVLFRRLYSGAQLYRTIDLHTDHLLLFKVRRGIIYLEPPKARANKWLLLVLKVILSIWENQLFSLYYYLAFPGLRFTFGLSDFFWNVLSICCQKIDPS